MSALRTPAEDAGMQLVGQMASCMDLLVTLTDSPPSELWSLYLAATGVMAYTDPDALDPETPRVLGVPDGYARPAGTRLDLLRTTLWQVVYLLGDPEAHHRTGFTTAELHAAVLDLFDADVRRAGRR